MGGISLATLILLDKVPKKEPFAFDADGPNRGYWIGGIVLNGLSLSYLLYIRFPVIQ